MAATAAVVEVDLSEPRFDGLLDAVGEEFPDVEPDRAGPTPRGAAPDPDRQREPGGPVRFASSSTTARARRGPRRGDRRARGLPGRRCPPSAPNGETLVELLRAPARAHPTSLAGQLRYVRERWGALLGEELDGLLDRLLLTLDVLAEEERGAAPALRWRRARRRPRAAARRRTSSGLDAEPERVLAATRPGCRGSC